MDSEAGSILVVFLLVLVIGAGMGPGLDLGFGTEGPAPGEGQYRLQPADEDCVALWNRSGGTIAAQRSLMGLRSKEMAIHVERLGNATPAGGTCGIVFADKRTGQTFATFASPPNGTGYVNITGQASARMYGRAYAPSMINAAMREDGTLVAVTPVSG